MKQQKSKITRAMYNEALLLRWAEIAPAKTKKITKGMIKNAEKILAEYNRQQKERIQINKKEKKAK